jgi:putative transposase
MARKSVKFELTAEQESTLKMWVGSHKTEQRHSRRAQVILLSAQGLTLEEISARSGLNRTNCMKWRKRFAVEGLDGLKDKPRKGRPATITPWQRAQVIRLACERPSNGANAWSRRELARVTGLGSTTVHRILEGASLKPHKVHHWCGRSPDPEFEPKQTDIIGLYLNPPENALIFSLDEKSQIQALDRTQPELPLRPGNPKRHTATYTRHGTTCLLAALAVHEGTVEARCVDSNSRHVMEWVSRRRRLTLHFTPTYASWLNQIEIWFHIFSHDVVKGGIWRSKKELVDQIMLYIKRYNRDRAHPFTWTYTGKVLVA